MRKSVRVAWGSFVFCLLVLSGEAYGQCRDDEYLAGEDADFWYCAQLEDRPQIENLMHAIDRAAKAPSCVGEACNYFVGKIGELLDVPYFRDILTDTSSDGRLANEIYSFVARAVQTRASGWRAVPPEEAQQLANRGRFVIGVARHIDPSSSHHGHIVIATPPSMPHAGNKGTGPWVRDSQNPDLSVRASKRFGSSVVEPIWAVWKY